MEEKTQTNGKSNQRMIREAIRKIALGRSIERIDMAPTGINGVGTARMVHGYVAKVHNNPNDEEYEEYAGTIDVRNSRMKRQVQNQSSIKEYYSQGYRTIQEDSLSFPFYILMLPL